MLVTGLIVLLIVLLIGLLIVQRLPFEMPLVAWQHAVFAPDLSDYRQVIVHFNYLPRIAMALLCGAGLALAGCVMQYVLRNPLASPTTLGVAAGAELGLAMGLLYLPATLAIDAHWLAFVGGLAATGLVFLLTASRGCAPLQMVLAGMVVSLFFGSLNMMLMLINEQQLTSLFIWGAGALEQNDWQGVTQLLPLLVVPSVLLVLLSRPLALLQLGDAVATSIGVRVAWLRGMGIVAAVFMTAAVVSQVGIIGFVGLVAPALARLVGARTLLMRLLTSALIGAALLLVADLCIQPFSGVGGELLPTGAMTALLGAPCLLWLLHRQSLAASLKAEPEGMKQYHPRSVIAVGVGLLVVLAGVLWLSLMVGNSQYGWQISVSPNVLALRFPRIAVALLAGVALALAGTVIQRVTGNGMASPEVLGISAGAAVAVVCGAMLGMTTGRGGQLLLGTLGAFSVMIMLWLSGRRHRFAPAQILLTGIGLSAAMDALIRIAMSSGQENVHALMAWLSGSTYLASGSDALVLLVGVIVLGGGLILCHRWLDLMGLGEVVANALGVDGYRVRLLLMFIAAMLTALATLVVGPLSFIGLLAPHMAKALGQYRARDQLVIACLLGGIVMVLADWLGRNLWFPWQFPAGLLASLVGGGYFIYLLRKP
ncbi:Fe(3+)-hydroxamate ABC transporter permease FhuB [Photobacterium japonica]|uniref:Fe(3+)-hydroxamate ABC transporter permease FhuB n=1 Tax=Photobacterium japonica TaxID=2910235 RepID=UPI003D125EF2